MNFRFWLSPVDRKSRWNDYICVYLPWGKRFDQFKFSDGTPYYEGPSQKVLMVKRFGINRPTLPRFVLTSSSRAS